MKKKLLSVVCAVLAMLMTCSVIFAGCFGGKEQTPVNTEPKEYTIQYTDDVGAHTLTVTEGMPYNLEVIPEKTGYEFLGLYDAEVGGTQYVSASGSSLSPFTDGKNMVLFPQFKAKEYTVILDYQGAAVTGSRQLTVSYGSSLPELPKNLTLEHKEFAGWFTEEECGGTQVADEYGLIPLVSVLNEDNFDLKSTSLTLYAGFEAEKFTVTFCFEAGMDTEEMQVEYNTPISQVVPKTRVGGNAVLTWSKSQGGEVWNGNVTGEMVLYAVEYAPVIELDSNGGKEVTPVVARAGSTIVLPTPTKDMAKFVKWEDMQGNEYTSTTMPSSSISLKAVWQAKIAFDENGGSDVDDISVSAGSKITLPMSSKDGYIFAGWYTEDKEKYTSTTMPSAGITLKAGWYKEITEQKVVIGSTSESYAYNRTTPSTSNLCYTLTHGNYAERGQEITITLDLYVKLKTGSSTSQTVYFDVYSQKQISTTYLMTTKSFTNVTNSYKEYSTSITLTVSDDFYVCWYSTAKSTYMYLSDYYRVLHYPDTSVLYL